MVLEVVWALSLLYFAFTCACYFQNDSHIQGANTPVDGKSNSNNKPCNSETNIKQWHRCIDSLTRWFDQEQLETSARQCGFLRRKPRKITPLLFVQAAVLLVSQRAVSLSRWSALLGVIGGMSVAKQSLWQRVNTHSVAFLEDILGRVIGERLQGGERPVPEALKSFARVFIQDSTAIKLSAKLAAVFPGARNHHGAKNGVLKLQAVYELVSQRFVHFSLSGFTRNDQAAAYDILSLLKPGELVLRDLGYFVIGSFQQIACCGAFFLSRFRLDSKVYDPRTGRELNLLGHLKRQGQMDQQVLLGRQRMAVRLVAVKLPEPVAAQRRRKARSNRDKRCHPKARSLQLLGWSIFVTNVPSQRCSAKTIAQLYGLRWQIESLFKVWKSHFGLTQVPRGSTDQLLVMIYARLVFITVITQIIQMQWLEQTDGQPAGSRFKLAAMLSDYFLLLCLEAWGIRTSQLLLRQLTYHGRYDRRTRLNSAQKLMKLS